MSLPAITGVPTNLPFRRDSGAAAESDIMPFPTTDAGFAEPTEAGAGGADGGFAHHSGHRSHSKLPHGTGGLGFAHGSGHRFPRPTGGFHMGPGPVIASRLHGTGDHSGHAHPTGGFLPMMSKIMSEIEAGETFLPKMDN